MPAQSIDKVLDAVGVRCEKVVGRGRVSRYKPASLTDFPQVVLRYLDSPFELSSSRQRIDHVVEIEAIIAPLASVELAREEATKVISAIKTELMNPLDLIPPPNQTTTGARGSQALREVVYNDQIYHAAILIIRCVEVTGETFGL
jgi:hypothetical protein